MTRRRQIVLLSFGTIVLILSVGIYYVTTQRHTYRFLSRHKSISSHSELMPNGDTLINRVYSFEADYGQLCSEAGDELVSRGFKDLTHAHSGARDYTRLTIDQTSISLVKNEVFHSKAPEGSSMPFNYAHREGWVSVKVTQLKPKNPLGFLWMAWSDR